GCDCRFKYRAAGGTRCPSDQNADRHDFPPGPEMLAVYDGRGLTGSGAGYVIVRLLDWHGSANCSVTIDDDDLVGSGLPGGYERGLQSDDHFFCAGSIQVDRASEQRIICRIASGIACTEGVTRSRSFEAPLSLHGSWHSIPG